MPGMDRRTGKWIERPAHIRQSIEVILTTPVGTRVMRREFGFDALDNEGRTKPDTTVESASQSAREALIRWEPGVDFLSVQASLVESGALKAVRVQFRDKETGEEDETTVLFPV